MCETVCHVSVRCCLFRVPSVSVYSMDQTTVSGFVSTWCNAPGSRSRSGRLDAAPRLTQHHSALQLIQGIDGPALDEVQEIQER